MLTNFHRLRPMGRAQEMVDEAIALSGIFGEAASYESAVKAVAAEIRPHVIREERMGGKAYWLLGRDANLDGWHLPTVTKSGASQMSGKLKEELVNVTGAQWGFRSECLDAVLEAVESGNLPRHNSVWLSQARRAGTAHHHRISVGDDFRLYAGGLIGPTGSKIMRACMTFATPIRVDRITALRAYKAWGMTVPTAYRQLRLMELGQTQPTVDGIERLNAALDVVALVQGGNSIRAVVGLGDLRNFGMVTSGAMAGDGGLLFDAGYHPDSDGRDVRDVHRMMVHVPDGLCPSMCRSSAVAKSILMPVHYGQGAKSALTHLVWGEGVEFAWRRVDGVLNMDIINEHAEDLTPLGREILRKGGVEDLEALVKGYVNNFWSAYRRLQSWRHQVAEAAKTAPMEVTTPVGKYSHGAWEYAQDGSTFVAEGVTFRRKEWVADPFSFPVRAAHVGDSIVRNGAATYVARRGGQDLITVHDASYGCVLDRDLVREGFRHGVHTMLDTLPEAMDGFLAASGLEVRRNWHTIDLAHHAVDEGREWFR